jgi:hypothetical protein
MALIQCEVADGPRTGFKTVGIPSIEGHTEYLTIEERFLVRRGDDFLLPVREISRDQQHGTSLVQLPVEADSGARRVWVWRASIDNTTKEVPA